MENQLEGTKDILKFDLIEKVLKYKGLGLKSFFYVPTLTKEILEVIDPYTAVMVYAHRWYRWEIRKCLDKMTRNLYKVDNSMNIFSLVDNKDIYFLLVRKSFKKTKEFKTILLHYARRHGLLFRRWYIVTDGVITPSIR